MKKKYYRINKVLNNNAIEVLDKGKEIVIFGNGVGFAHKPKDYIEMKEGFKIYELQSNVAKNQFETLINEIPFDCIQLTQKIIDMAKSVLKQDFNQGLLVSLSDHINFVVKNHLQGKQNYTLVSEEVKRFYNNEYNVGIKAVEMINQHYQIELKVEEASAIAFHLINSEYNNDINQTTNIMKSIEDIIEIIKSSLGLELNEDSLYYSRFIIHLKFFMQRVIKEENEEDDTFESLVINTKSDINKKIGITLDLISDYLVEKFDYKISDAERFYLLVHITRMI